MVYWTNLKNDNIEIKLDGKRNKYDSNIYTFDIETTSFLYDSLNKKCYPTNRYLKFKNNNIDYLNTLDFASTMYIWQFGINDTIYFGRTFEDLANFLDILEEKVPYKKYLFIHNASFEFQYLKSVFKFDRVLARQSRKVMSACFVDYNIEIRCTLVLTNCSLDKLADVYQLPIKKLKGNLDYNKLRHYNTKLTKKELKYCENDCLVIYYYILLELKTYKHLNAIPLTSTGHVRKELKSKVLYNYRYTSKVRKAINTDPYIFDLLTLAFCGGYVHSNYLYTNEIIKNVDSWDFVSSYPYVMCCYKYPMSKFKKCIIKDVKELNNNFAYLLVVEMKKGKSKYLNTFLSASKVLKGTLKNAVYDNGRLISFDSATLVLTDIDIYLIDCYNYDTNFSYEIKESYYATYNYLPKQLIEFILDKYEDKTKFKDVVGKEVEYALAKALFNAIYGMTVTNIIRSNVKYSNELDWLPETNLTNDEIVEKLENEEKKGFLSFAWGVWVTAYARRNLIQNIIKLDKYNIYSDTDSLKLMQGYDKKIIDDYNELVKLRILKVSKKLNIDYNRFQPIDCKGKRHLLGVFDNDGQYLEFITQGAKKYAVKKLDKNNNEIIQITVAGVPKKASKQLKSLNDFKDGLVFEYRFTNKLLLSYIEDQKPIVLKDYQNNDAIITNKTGCCLLPTTYVLGKTEDYTAYVQSSERNFYKLEDYNNYLTNEMLVY